MIDIRRFRTEPDAIRRGLANRGRDVSVVDRIVELDERRRDLVTQVDSLRSDVNSRSKEVGRLKQSGEDASAVQDEVRVLKERLKGLEDNVAACDADLEVALISLPNIPSESTPDGKDESENVGVREVGARPSFDFAPRAHWDVGEALGILDFDYAAKLAGARFNIYYADGARLERALIQYMLDMHVARHGYTEVSPPFLAQRAIMQGTGQVPALEEDMWRCEHSELYLIPTAEVPLTALHFGDILEEERLPRMFTAYTPCFRREAGAAGKDTRGLVRRHQFDKVEMVWLTHPDESFAALERLTSDAEDVLKGLALPYRVIELCTGDLGTASCKTYDLEVWMPGLDRWLEISSCSNCLDFQARRCNMRFRPADGGKPEFVHSLNGSGVAVGRCLAAVLENNQQSDGTVRVPEALRGYMAGQETLEPAPNPLR